MNYKLLLKIGSIVCFVLAAFGTGHFLWIPIGLALFVGSNI